MEPAADEAQAPREQSFLPYDDSIATQEVKMRHCFIASSDILSKAIAADVPRDRAAADVFAAIQRQSEAISKHSGKRHLFVFLHESSVAQFEDAARVAALKTVLTNEKIVVHGFAPGLACAAFRDMCLSFPDGTFSDATVDELPDRLEEFYSLLMNGCVISYQLQSAAEVAPAKLRVSSNLGSGEVEIEWQQDAPAE